MSIYSNVTEEGLINLRKLAEQQKNERALKIKIKILKQTHDKKLPESLSPITIRLDLIENNKGVKIGDIIKKSQEETPQLAIESTPVENNEEVIQDVELQNTLNYMKNNVGFFNIEERDNGDVFWNGFPVERMGGNKLKINENIFDITPGIQKVLTDTSNTPLKKLNNQDRDIYCNILETLDFEKYKAIRGESKSGRYKQSKSFFNKHNLEGQGVYKTVIPSNIIDIYTRFEVLLALKLSGHTDTFTEATKLIDELYKRGEIQKKNNNIEMLLTNFRYKYLQINLYE